MTGGNHNTTLSNKDFLTYLGRDSNPGSGERQRTVSGGALDSSAIRPGSDLLHGSSLCPFLIL